MRNHLLWPATVAIAAVPTSAQVPFTTIDGELAGDRSGHSVAGLGDMNGDGTPDLVMGLFGRDCGCSTVIAPDCGRARVFDGAAGTIMFQHVGNGPAPGGGCGDGDRVGIAVASAGDVDDDGVPDYLVGADQDDPAGTQSGSARIYSGATGGLIHQVNGSGGDRVGTALDGLGDVNGDGNDDVLIGIPFDDPNSTADAGAVLVVSGADGSVLHTVQGTSPDDWLGLSVAGIGDVSGDSVPDFAFGVPQDDFAGNDAGSVRVHSGADGSFLYRLDGTSAGDNFGHRVCRLGDADGDTFPDFAVSAPGAETVRLVSGPFASTIVEIPTPTAGIGFGAAIAGAADADGDGDDDLIVGAPAANQDDGAAYVYSGQGVLLGSMLGSNGARFGISVSSIGRWEFDLASWVDTDFSGDGLADVLVGASRDFSDNGRVWIFPGICLRGQAVCASNPNSATSGALIDHTGSLSIGANNFALTVTNAPPNKPGLFYYGTTSIQFPFGDGFRCVGGATYRLYPFSFTNGSGQAARPIDLTAPPQPAGAIQPLSTWYFQYWFRDPSGPGGAGFNLTNGLQASFCN